MKPMPIRISELAHSSYYAKPLDDLKPKTPRDLNTEPSKELEYKKARELNPEPPKDLLKEIQASNLRTNINHRDQELESLRKKQEFMTKDDEKYAEKAADIQRRIEELQEQNRLDNSALIGIWNNRLDIFA